MKLIIAFCFSLLSLSALAQPYEEAYVDTALHGEWELADPAMLKMLTSSGEPYLLAKVTFADRKVFNNGRTPNLEWAFNTKTQELEIADMEEMTVRPYLLKQLDAEILILQVGKQEIIFKRKR